MCAQIEIKTVEHRSDLKKFIDFYYELYRDCAYAVPFLFGDEMKTLRSDRNPSFECCEACYFMAFKSGRMVGRIAAIINHRANEKWGCKEVRFNWFDFVDDPEVSTALLDAAEKWGRERGMNEIAGPLGFTDMDREGMLIEGFDRLSTMYTNYNYPYYRQHIERLEGFAKDNDYLEYRIKIPEVAPPKFEKLSRMIETRYNLHVHKFTSDELLNKGMGRRLFEIVNATYKDLYGYSELSDRQIDGLVNDYIRKADLNLVTAVVDGNRNNEMIGFGITFPSFSRALQKTRDGRLFPMGWWPLLRVLKWHKTDMVDLLLIGILPEYRKKGANALIFNDLIDRSHQYGFKWAEAMPQMETNTAVQSEWQYFESEQHRRHRCYRKKMG